MSTPTKEELEKLDEMYRTDAWKILERLINNDIDIFNNVQGLNTLEELHHTKGQQLYAQRMVTFHLYVENALEELNNAV